MSYKGEKGFNNGFIVKQLRQYDKMNDFIAEVNLFMNESYVERLEEHVETIRLYLQICNKWTIQEKGEMIQKLKDLRVSLNQRIQSIKPNTAEL